MVVVESPEEGESRSDRENAPPTMPDVLVKTPAARVSGDCRRVGDVSPVYHLARAFRFRSLTKIQGVWRTLSEMFDSASGHSDDCARQ
jgi:hypothetical protein